MTTFCKHASKFAMFRAASLFLPGPDREGERSKIVHDGILIDFFRAAIVSKGYLEYPPVAT
jgi:hypothetical protein